MIDLLLINSDIDKRENIIDFFRGLGFRSVNFLDLNEKGVITGKSFNKIYEAVKSFSDICEILLIVNCKKGKILISSADYLARNYRLMNYPVVFAGSEDLPTSQKIPPYSKLPGPAKGLLVYADPSCFMGGPKDILKFFDQCRFNQALERETFDEYIASWVHVLVSVTSTDRVVEIDRDGVLLCSKSLELFDESDINRSLINKNSCTVSPLVYLKSDNHESCQFEELAGDYNTLKVLNEMALSIYSKAYINEFLNVWDRYKERTSLDFEKAHIIMRLCQQSRLAGGDAAEFGARQGGCSRIIAELISECGGNTFLFDTFSCYPKRSLGDAGRRAQSASPTYNNLDELREYLSGLNVTICKGEFPKTLPKDFKNVKLSFVHIDFNSCKGTRESLKAVYPILNRGGVIVFDDYADQDSPGVTKAVNEFFRRKKSEIVLRTPAFNCQGVVVKLG